MSRAGDPTAESDGLVNAGSRLRRQHDELKDEVLRLAEFNRAAGLNFNVGCGKRGGLFDKKLDRLRARLLLVEVELGVTEQP